MGRFFFSDGSGRLHERFIEVVGIAGIEVAVAVTFLATNEAIALEVGDDTHDGAPAHAAAAGNGFVGGPGEADLVIMVVGKAEEDELFEWLAGEGYFPGEGKHVDAHRCLSLLIPVNPLRL